MYDWIRINLLAIVSLFILCLTALYLYLSRNYDYFKSIGIDGPKPIIIFGTLYKLVNLTVKEMFAEDYKKYGRIYGWFFGSRPALMINDINLIKDICIKDFHIFVNRNDILTGDPFDDRQLIAALGDDWKQLRSVISPTFSSGKMRKMHPIIEDCVKSVNKILMNAANNKQEVELKKLMGNYSMDVIATCAFATKIDTYNDTNNQFVNYAQKVFSFSWKAWISLIMLLSFPIFAKKLNLSFVDSDVKLFFTQAIKSILNNRKNSKEKHVDFLQLMIDEQNKDNVIDKDDKHNENNGSIYETSENLQIDKTQSKLEMSDIDIIATAFIFLIAAYETTSSLLSFFCHSLAMHEDCQQKLYEELKSVDKLDYDTISRLPYLDACIAETQRLYRSATFTSRIASEEYKLGNTGITIPKGMFISINIEGIHHDPEYYPNPDRFDPERFMPENRSKLIPYTFLPFGIGPRNCVGMRFALMEAKTAIAHIISKFKFVRTANTEVPLTFKKLAFILSPQNGIKVGVEIRNS